MTKKIRTDVCEVCDGKGWIDGKMCRRCQGVGKHWWGSNPEAIIAMLERKKKEREDAGKTID